MPDARGDDVSRRELERQISELKRDKTRIEDVIRRMEVTQQRIFREEPIRPKVEDEKEEKPEEPKGREEKRKRESEKDREDDEASDEEEGSEKKKARGEDAAEEEAKSREERRKREREKDGRPTKIDPRSRNLFGKLLGHLHQAKSRLEKEKGTKAATLHQKAQDRIEEKLSLSKMNIKEFRKAQFEQQKKEEVLKVQQIEKEIEQKELLLLQRRLESHYSLMMNFIRSKAEPTIFYLPAKHTRQTEAALEDTRAAIKHKIASLKVQLQPTPEGEESEESLRKKAAAAAVAAAEAIKEENKKVDEDTKKEAVDEDAGKNGKKEDEDEDEDEQDKEAKPQEKPEEKQEEGQKQEEEEEKPKRVEEDDDKAKPAEEEEEKKDDEDD